MGSRDSAVDSDWLQVRRKRGRSSSPGTVKSFLHVVETGSGANPACYPIVPGAVSPGVKRPGHKFTTYLQLVPRSRKRGSILPLPIRHHGVMLNYLSTGTTLPFLPLRNT
jgi:hypothetical protein